MKYLLRLSIKKYKFTKYKITKYKNALLWYMLWYIRASSQLVCLRMINQTKRADSQSREVGAHKGRTVPRLFPLSLVIEAVHDPRLLWANRARISRAIQRWLVKFARYFFNRGVCNVIFCAVFHASFEMHNRFPKSLINAYWFYIKIY